LLSFVRERGNHATYDKGVFMRKTLIALLFLTTPALAEMPQDVMELMSRTRVIYIRGEDILMTVTGIKLDRVSLVTGQSAENHQQSAWITGPETSP
jgi:hypothetical protein